jgi:hypothetical protein
MRALYRRRVLSWALAARSQVRRGRDGKEINLALIDNVQQGVRCAIGDASKICSALYVQTISEINVSDLAGRALFHDTDDTQLLSQANDNDAAISRIQVLAIQVAVQTSDPCAIALLDLSTERWTELG